MPLPFILGGIAAVAGAAGVASGVSGAKKMKDANDTMKSAQNKHEKNIERFEEHNKMTTQKMDSLGKKELEILKSFERFSQSIEKIQNKPEFKAYKKESIEIPKYDSEELNKVSVGAGVLLGGIGGAAVGTAGGFAAAGATTSAVMALGTASTGTAIASLSGAAATNATLAAIGGGAIGSSTFAGGMALGSTILGVTTLGVGLLVGGVIFNVTGGSLSDKADEAWSQMRKAEKEIDKICVYLDELRDVAYKYILSIEKVEKSYKYNLNRLENILRVKTDWNYFSDEEKLITENTILIVGLLYNMCKVELVLKSNSEDELNRINKVKVDETIQGASDFLRERSLLIY